MKAKIKRLLKSIGKVAIWLLVATVLCLIISLLELWIGKWISVTIGCALLALLVWAQYVGSKLEEEKKERDKKCRWENCEEDSEFGIVYPSGVKIMLCGKHAGMLWKAAADKTEKECEHDTAR